MNTQEKTHRYIEWISPEDMHAETVEWMSELKFAQDEQRFLNSLVKHYTLQLVGGHNYAKSKELVGSILDAENELEKLLKEVQLHENQLEILVDDVDQPKMEQAYKETHKELTGHMQNYLERYRDLKKRLFNLITVVMKKDKQNRLLN